MRRGRIVRITLFIVFAIGLSLVIHFTGIGWVATFYSTLLALFAPEIRSLFDKVLAYKKTVRIMCSYYFRIIQDHYYLLVNEHGEDVYRPVGGVYKYRDISIADEFGGVYDGTLPPNDDTKDDLRITISGEKVKKFFEWFRSGYDRENFEDLTREFKEELIDTGLLPAEPFVGKKLTYHYVGSHHEHSMNPFLHKKQFHHYDIVCMKPYDSQSSAIKKLCADNSIQERPPYIFATEEDINRGYLMQGSYRHIISEVSKHILVNAQLTRESSIKGLKSPTML